MELVYVDHDQSLNDTIRIFMPLEKPQKGVMKDTVAMQSGTSADTAHTEPAPAIVVAPPVSKPAADTGPADSSAKKEPVEGQDTANARKVEEVIMPEPKPKDTVFNKSLNTDAGKKDEMVVLPRVVKSSTTNSDCKAFATNEDFLRLRKKMASENSNDRMVQVAKKVFRTKCFSTEQIRNLSYLFLTDEGKYMFFDAAYAFTSDSDQYQLLKSQLKDDYYIKRFDAMIHN